VVLVLVVLCRRVEGWPLSAATVFLFSANGKFQVRT